MLHKWKKEEVDYIIKNYPEFGYSYCANNLNININKVKSKVTKMKLKLKDKTDISVFENIRSKEVSYILGLLWADGNINNVGNNYEVKIESNKDDMKEIRDVIMMTGNWNEYHRDGRNRNETKCKDSVCYKIGFKKLYNIFENYGFDDKSFRSPSILLSSIPNDIRHYFYRGLSDGDGCFYINKKNYNYQYIISSTYEQEWLHMIDLCEKLKINNYSIKRYRGKKGCYSQFKITNKIDIKKIGNYIYYDRYKDNIGLRRKYEKFMQI